MFFMRGCFATHITLPGMLCVKIPDTLTFDDAATMPVVYLTALHSLLYVGGLKRGEVCWW